MKESQFWCAFSCWFRDALIPVRYWLFQSKERIFWPGLHQPAIRKISWCGFCEQLISKFRNNKEKSKISWSMRHHVFSMRFSAIFEWFPIINFWLFCMKENIKLCKFVSDLECAENFEGWEWNIVDIWHQQNTLLSNQKVSVKSELGSQCLKGALWWAEDSERAHRFAIPHSQKHCHRGCGCSYNVCLAEFVSDRMA